MANKSYDQYCPIARGLDLLGERWTLLILRELSLEDQRFTDLRRALKGIAPNLLSDRLTQLQEAGLVEQAELPPPAARTVYRLTEEGMRAVPVIRAIGRFGVRYLPEEPDLEVPLRRRLIAVLAPWSRRDVVVGAAGLDLVVEADGERQRIRLLDRGTDVQPVPDDDPVEPALRFSTKALAAFRRTGEPFDAEVLDPEVAATFADAFALSLE
jgi:DNA-binding HxlR family transcriptional regulator